MLNVRVCCCEMLLDTPQQFSECSDPRIEDDPGVLLTIALPCLIDSDEIYHVVCEHRAAVFRRIGQLLLVRDTLIDTVHLVATDRIVATLPKCMRKTTVDMLIREEFNRCVTGHRGERFAVTCVLRAISSSTRSGCSR